MSQNTATLINYSYDWRIVPVAAWASTGLSKQELEMIPVENRLDYLFEVSRNTRLRSPESLVEFLVSEGHTSPFRHITFTYLLTTDKPTHIQLLKHRVGVEINSESARYKKLTPSYYMPQDLPVHVQTKLQAIYDIGQSAYEEIYQDLIDCGYSKQRAKEAARFALPEGHQISFILTCSAQALKHLYELRGSGNAQLEINLLVQSMVSQVEETGKFDPLVTFIRG